MKKNIDFIKLNKVVYETTTNTLPKTMDTDEATFCINLEFDEHDARGFRSLR